MCSILYYWAIFCIINTNSYINNFSAPPKSLNWVKHWNYWIRQNSKKKLWIYPMWKNVSKWNIIDRLVEIVVKKEKYTTVCSFNDCYLSRAMDFRLYFAVHSFTAKNEHLIKHYLGCKQYPDKKRLLSQHHNYNNMIYAIIHVIIAPTTVHLLFWWWFRIQLLNFTNDL